MYQTRRYPKSVYDQRGWSPARLDGLVLYYDPLALETGWTDDAGTSRAGDGDPVGRRDSRFDGVNFVQDRADSRPQFIAGEGDQYDGADDYLEHTDAVGISGSQNRTLVGCFRYDGTDDVPNRQGVFTINEDGSSTGGSWRITVDDGGLSVSNRGGTSTSSLGFPDEMSFFAVRMDGSTLGDHTVWLGDDTEDLIGTSTLDTIDQNTRIGRYLGSREGEVTIGALGLYDRALSDAEVARCRRYYRRAHPLL